MGKRVSRWAPERTRIADFIFYQPGLLEFSPVVTVWWRGEVEVIDLLNRLPVDIWGGGEPGQQCGRFVAACAALPEVDLDGVALLNWVYAPGGPADADDVGWSQRVLAWFTAMNPPPVLINLNPPFDVRRGSAVLCRWVAVEYKEGGPAWVAPG